MVLRMTLTEVGLDLTWWQSALVLAGIVVGMVLWGWLEFRVGSVDIEQELWSEHTPLLRRLDRK